MIQKYVSLYRCSLYKFLNLAILPVCITMFMTKIKLHILHHNTSNCKPTLIYFIFNTSEYIFLTKLWLLCFLWHVLVSVPVHDCCTARGQKITYIPKSHTHPGSLYGTSLTGLSYSFEQREVMKNLGVTKCFHEK